MSHQKGILTFFSKKVDSKTNKRSRDNESINEDQLKDTIEQSRSTNKKRRFIESDSEEEEDEPTKETGKKELTPPSTGSNGHTKKGTTHMMKTPPKRATARKHTGNRLPLTKKPKITEQSSSKDQTASEDDISMDTISNVDSNNATQVSEIKEENKQDCEKCQPVKDGKENNSTALSKKSAVYNPSKSNYDPIQDANWSKDQKYNDIVQQKVTCIDRVPYLSIAKTFGEIEQITGRLKIISILTNFLRSVIALSPHEMSKCIYLCLNKLGPAYEGIELGIGDSILIKALSSATGRNPQQIKAEVAEKGDLGLVAEGSRTTQRTMFRPPPLTVHTVFNKLTDIAKLTGNSSQNKKVEIIKGLFVACRDCEAKYLIRSLSGKLRIGLAEQSVLTALAHAVTYTPPEQPSLIVDASQDTSAEKFRKELDKAVTIVKNAYCELPNYDVLIPALLKYGVTDLAQHCSLTPGIPLKPMLAHPTKGIQEVLHRLDQCEFTCEWKYDGERAQIHILENGEVQIYSRNQENNTSKYPDIVARMPQVLNEGVKSCVIDTEAVAWDVETKQILPFQVLSTRKRKDADISSIKVQVCLFAFDVLYLNGEPLVRESFRKRRELLKSSFKEIEGEFMFVQFIDSTNTEDIQTFMEESMKGNCEGLMVKTLDKNASYEIAKRSHNWLKLKKDYLDGVGDTLDLVVIGGFHGTGKRTGKYGGFLLACYDKENEEYQVICKIGTGFKDDELDRHTNFLKDHIIESPKSYYNCSESIKPDHWFDAVQVWEVKTADLSISPVYPAAAGIVDPEKGISLRFPRFLRIREDKKPEQATTSQQVATLYRQQQNIVKQSGDAPEIDDFY